MSVFKQITDKPEIYTFQGFCGGGLLNFVTGRGGGVSPVPYNTLNTDTNGGDTPRNVNENIERIKRALGVDVLWTPRQVHGDAIAVVDETPPPDGTVADAVIVTRAGIAVGVRTADCLPIIIAAPDGSITAVIHAGRRSVELGITEKTIVMMEGRFGVNPSKLSVVIGPGIRKCCYEVDETTAERFHSCCGGEAGRYLDLAAANMRQLVKSGVKAENVADCGICSSCENHRFFSYRRDRNTTGRFLTGVMLRRLG